MSFRCGICNRPQPDGTMANRRLTHYREVVYDTVTHKYKKSKKVNTKQTQGYGWEIDREVLCCELCDEQLGEPDVSERKTVKQTQVEQV